MLDLDAARAEGAAASFAWRSSSPNRRISRSFASASSSSTRRSSARRARLRLLQLGAIGGVANRRVRLLQERLATFRALLEFGERALPLLGVRDVDATGERGFHSGQRRVLRLRERPGIFPEAEQPPILHLQTAVQTQTIRRRRSASASATCTWCLSCASRP